MTRHMMLIAAALLALGACAPSAPTPTDGGIGGTGAQVGDV